MDSINKLVVRLEETAPDNRAHIISWFLDDVFKMIKTINTTSMNNQDRTDRLIEFEKSYGIPKTHLL